MQELFWRYTSDSHRVRTNNAITSMEEVVHVLSEWVNHNVKKYVTVEMCVNEAVNLVKNNDCVDFSFYDRDLFISELSVFKKECPKEMEAIKPILLVVNKFIECNLDKYVNNLFSRIEESIFVEDDVDDDDLIPVVGKIDGYCIELSCELIRLGYSKGYLYSKFSKFAKYSLQSFDDAYPKLKALFLSHEKKKYIVIHKLMNLTKDRIEIIGKNLKLIEAVDEQYSFSENMDLKNFLGHNDGIRYCVQEIEALDYNAAVKESVKCLSEELDQLQSIFKFRVANEAMTLEKNDFNKEADFFARYVKSSVLDGIEHVDEKFAQSLHDCYFRIQSNSLIAQDVKQRIKSALRHLRIGDKQIELEQRYLNYWIALEFIFSTSSEGSTFVRLKPLFLDMVSCCYVKRNYIDFVRSLKRKKIISEEENSVNFSMLESSDNWDKLDILARYRIKRMKSHLHSHDSISKYNKKHRYNVESHIVRMYRYRNELVHDGAIKSNIEGITSNLRSYLVFVLNQMLYFFANTTNTKTLDTSDFFYEYGFWHKVILNAKDENVLDKFLSVPYEYNILK